MLPQALGYVGVHTADLDDWRDYGAKMLGGWGGQVIDPKTWVAKERTEGPSLCGVMSVPGSRRRNAPRRALCG
jgi:hypothetical protein